MNSKHSKSDIIQWNKGVKAAIYNGRIVALNETSNDFVFFDEAQSSLISSVLGKCFSKLMQTEADAVNDLISHGLISLKATATEIFFQDSIVSKGAFECAWALGDSRISLLRFSPKYFLQAIFYLLLAKRHSAKGELYELLEKLRHSILDNIYADDDALITIASNVNLAIACLWRKIRCLEFSYTVAQIAFINKINCRFVIGVQTHPFISHAWIEGENGVVFDRQELPREMAKIVTIGGNQNA